MSSVESKQVSAAVEELLSRVDDVLEDAAELSAEEWADFADNLRDLVFRAGEERGDE